MPFFVFSPLKKQYMKKLVIALALALSVSLCTAQRFVGYVAAGANFSQIEGDDVHGFYKVGVNAGPGVMLPLNRKQTWTVSAELLYVQKGSFASFNKKPFDTTIYAPTMYEDIDRSVPFNGKVKCKMALDYIQVPVMFRYEDMRSGCFIGAGFSWSRLVRAKEIYNGFTRTTSLTTGTFKTNDWSVLAEAGVRLYKNLTLNVRWEYSIVPIRTMVFQTGRSKSDGTFEITETRTNKLHNHVLSCRLVYFINEKFTRNTKVKNDGTMIGTRWVRDIPKYD